MDFRVEDSFKNISLEGLEDLYFNEEYNIAMCKAVKLARTLDKREEKDGHLLRVVRVGPDREIPKPVAKVIGANRIEYTEHMDYILGQYKGTWHTVSSLMTEKVDTRGTLEMVERPGGPTRIIAGTIKVKVFGVGKLIEKFIVSDIEKSFKDAAVFMQKWIDSDGKP